MRHELKTWPEPFRAVRHKEKKYEIRVNDRDYQVGDVLHLREWDPSLETYSGYGVKAVVTYMTRGGEWGLPANMCVMSIHVTTVISGDKP